MRKRPKLKFTRRTLPTHGAFYSVQELEARFLLAAQPTMTFFSATPNPVTSGNYITLQATVLPVNVGGMPGGMVAFVDTDTSTTIGSAPLNSGSAQLTAVTTLPVGTDNIEANYLGSTNFSPSRSGSTAITVQGANSGLTTSSASLTTSAATIVVGQSVDFTVKVTAGATGDVDFTCNGSPIGSATISGTTAVLPTSNLPQGTDSIVASYLGDSTYAQVTSNALTETVKPSSGASVATTTSLTESSNSITAGQPVVFTATVNNPNATGTVDFISGSTDLSGPVNVTSGVATFSDSTLAGGTYTVSATYSGDSTYLSSQSTTVTVTVATATTPTTTTLAASSAITFVGQPVTFSATVNNPNATGTVDFTNSDGTDLSGPIAIVSHVATFITSSLAIGQYNITATYSGDSTYIGSASSPPFTETIYGPTVPTTTTLSSSLPSIYSGQSITFSAAIDDPAATGTVDFTNSDGTDLSGPITTTNGVADFTTSALTVGTYGITATYSGDQIYIGSASSPTLSFTVYPQYALSGKFIGTLPTNVAAGGSLSPQLQVSEGAGSEDIVNGSESTVYYLSTTPDLTGIISPALATHNYSLSVANGASHTEQQALTVPTSILSGTYYLVAQIDATQAINPNDTANFVASGPIAINNSTTLAFSPQPAGAIAGNAFSVKVIITNSNGTTQTTDHSQVALSIATGPSGGVFASTSTLTATAVNGVATFNNLILNTAGTYTLSASDTADGLSGFASSSFGITSTTAAKLVFTSPPAGTSAGATLPVAVAVQDKFGNIVTADSSTVTLALATKPAGATLGGTLSVSASAGVASFSNLVLTTAGNYSLVATDATLTGITSAIFAITALAPTQLGFARQPVGAAAGSTLAPVSVWTEDQYSNLSVGASATITLAVALGPMGSPLGGTVTATTSNGSATFSNLMLTKASVYTLSASAPGLNGVTSAGFSIVPATATTLAWLTAPPSSSVAGTALPAFSATVADQYGNLLTTANVIITVATGPTGATLGGVTTAATPTGIATFSGVVLNTIGTYTLRASTGSLSLTSGSISIVAGPAAKIAFTKPPASAVAGTALASIAVSVEDAGGNLISGNASSVTLSIATGPTGATLGGSLTAMAVKGVATFTNLLLTEAGTYTFLASDGKLTGAASLSFTISAASASALMFTTQPTNTKVGSKITPGVQVAAVDKYGNIVLTDASSITLAIATGPTGAKLAGTTTQKAVKGIATFANLSIAKAGNVTFKATDGKLTAALSKSVTI